MRDEQIIELYFDRDESAITETGAKYGAYCMKIAMNILHNRLDSEECTRHLALCLALHTASKAVKPVTLSGKDHTKSLHQPL